MRHLSYLLISLLCAGLHACKGRNDIVTSGRIYDPTGPMLLSTGSPSKDEDPSVIRASNGVLYLAWFSERGGNQDIYVTSNARGTEWVAPVRVTTDAGGDFNPHLFQDDDGIFHLTWFRWTALFVGHIWYNSSPDGMTWSTANEVQVTTTGNVDDWVPTITKAADGTLLIYFVSDKRDTVNPASDIYVTTRPVGQSVWTAPVAAAGINSSLDHDHLPFAARTGTTITLVWVRHDTSKALPWENPKSHIFSATSSNGLSWSAPIRITNDTDNVVNLFPALYRDQSSSWSFIWLSTRLGTPKVFELPVAMALQYPSAITENIWVSPGYSHKVVATASRGIYLAVWVQGPDGAQDIYYRFYER